jgi:hypothetical protein
MKVFIIFILSLAFDLILHRRVEAAAEKEKEEERRKKVGVRILAE